MTPAARRKFILTDLPRDPLHNGVTALGLAPRECRNAAYGQFQAALTAAIKKWKAKKRAVLHFRADGDDRSRSLCFDKRSLRLDPEDDTKTTASLFGNSIRHRNELPFSDRRVARHTGETVTSWRRRRRAATRVGRSVRKGRRPRRRGRWRLSTANASSEESPRPVPSVEKNPRDRPVRSTFRLTEPLPAPHPGAAADSIDFQGTLIRERGGKYWLSIPHERVKSELTVTSAPIRPERIVSIDPGVRTFLTAWSPGGRWEKLGDQAAQRLCRIDAHLNRVCEDIRDEVRARRETSRGSEERVRRSKKIRMLRRKAARMRDQLTHVVDDMHHKIARHLCESFDLILIPRFEVKRIAESFKKLFKCRVVRRRETRKLYLLSHYRFLRRLMTKAEELGKTVAIVNEAYTTKTCSSCGSIRVIGGSKVYNCPCGAVTDRDLNGAKNIFLRAVSRGFLVMVNPARTTTVAF